MKQEPPEPRRRHLPTWRRLGFEYLVAIVVYMLAFVVTGNFLVGLIAMLIAMVVLRVKRPPRTD